MPRTRGFDALGFAFRVSAEDQQVIEVLTPMLERLPARDATDGEYVVCRRSRQEGGPGYVLSRLGRRIACVRTAEELPAVLVRAVTRDALAATRALVLHAGGVERGGVAMALPGVSDAGKTTLVAALVRAGLGYLTDEALAVDRTTLQAVPYPKPLSIGRREVPPDALRADPVGRPAPIGVVVFPRYEPGSGTSLEPIGRGAAVIEAAAHTFGFSLRPRDNLDVLADVMRGATCFRLTTGNLDPAVRMLIDLLGAVGERERG